MPASFIDRYNAGTSNIGGQIGGAIGGIAGSVYGGFGRTAGSFLGRGLGSVIETGVGTVARGIGSLFGRGLGMLPQFGGSMNAAPAATGGVTASAGGWKIDANGNLINATTPTTGVAPRPGVNQNVQTYAPAGPGRLAYGQGDQTSMAALSNILKRNLR